MKKMILCFMLLAITAFAQENTDVSLKAGVMLKSGDNIAMLPSNAKVFSDDNFKIFLKPLIDGYYYAVYNDSSNAILLGKDFTQQDNLTILPSYSEDYQLDDNCDLGVITLFFSTDKLEDIEEAFDKTGEIPVNDWKVLEKEYLTATKDSILDKTEDSIVITGNVRTINEAFEEKLRLFSDPKLIIKQYIMHIK